MYTGAPTQMFGESARYGFGSVNSLLVMKRCDTNESERIEPRAAQEGRNGSVAAAADSASEDERKQTDGQTSRATQRVSAAWLDCSSAGRPLQMVVISSSVRPTLHRPSGVLLGTARPYMAKPAGRLCMTVN